MDAEYLAIGSAEDPKRFGPFGPALRMLTTVVSVSQKGFVAVDAGSKSLYKDGGVPLVMGARRSGMTYDWFGDEFGKVACPDDVEPPALGDGPGACGLPLRPNRQPVRPLRSRQGRRRRRRLADRSPGLQPMRSRGRAARRKISILSP